ncbi:MAG: helix-turn-helix domain-containing protein [Planctomycetaceae bacterium]|nr:helix-turn-helix domain-containing protein [Planctomycetaceae bacterium]
MNDEQELTQWIHRLTDGDSRAAEQLWETYFQKLVHLARRKLEGMTLRDVDEEDVALSAMHSFCRGMVTKKFPWVNDRHDLWKLLVTLTARKACAHRRRHYAVKRGGGGVRGESVFQSPNEDDRGNRDGIAVILGKEPSPDLAVGVAENCKRMLDVLNDERLRQIALLTLEGATTAEIAEKLGCVRRTVERKLERIREIWTAEE